MSVSLKVSVLSTILCFCTELNAITQTLRRYIKKEKRKPEVPVNNAPEFSAECYEFSTDCYETSLSLGYQYMLGNRQPKDEGGHRPNKTRPIYPSLFSL